ncbi:IS200/IS605 family transposase [Methanohalobium sp.]|uniref:IS200/IS605 family transposase n=1 Tax=Methanohalobium sp. TaxID=2837493 RepID=UPI0025F772D3|nr:IS200/IS605 family transposase [Methanohalobium sp.]
MNYNLDKSSHSVYSLNYHFVQCVKCRRNALKNPDVIDLLKRKINEIIQTFDVDVLNIECDEDHFHMIFKSNPSLDIPKYINSIKSLTSREIRRNYPEVKEILGKDAFWSRSYFLATTGQVTLDVLKSYIDNQGVKSASDKEI